MNASWLNHLQNIGGQRAENGAITFSTNAIEIHSAANGSILAILDHLAVIHVIGEDSEMFLQGQFSNDVRQVSLTQAQPSAWCSPKGRVLTQLFIARNQNGYFLLIPKPLADAMLKRLRMYVLRSKVSLQELGESHVCVGFAGAAAIANLQQQFGPLPAHDYNALGLDGGGAIIRLMGPTPRYLLLSDTNSLLTSWQTLSAGVSLTGHTAWDWLDIQSGFPWVSSPTSDEFVPHMLNLERLGAVSFTKGCYPGQEIVARTEYLGKVKRRLHKIHLNDKVIALPGQEIFTSIPGSQSIGKVINASAAADNGCDLLAVLQSEAAESEELHLGLPTGPILQIQPLPYSLESEKTPPATTA